MEKVIDKIELKLPFKPEYVRIARLVVAGISSRMGIDIDTIEDIKVAISEVCNKIVEKGSIQTSEYIITFYICSDRLIIVFSSDDPKLGNELKSSIDEFGISILEAFMDETEISPDSNSILTMTKLLRGSH